MFAPGGLFQLILTLVGKTKEPTIEFSAQKVLHLGRLQPYWQTFDWEKPTGDKHSSLLRTFINYGSKKSYLTLDPDSISNRDDVLQSKTTWPTDIWPTQSSVLAAMRRHDTQYIGLFCDTQHYCIECLFAECRYTWMALCWMSLCWVSWRQLGNLRLVDKPILVAVRVSAKCLSSKWLSTKRCGTVKTFLLKLEIIFLLSGASFSRFQQQRVHKEK